MRARLGVLAVVIALAAAGTTWHVLARRPARAIPAPATATLDSGQILFRSTARGLGYGQVGAVPAGTATGTRAFAPVSCDRLHAAAGRLLCLSADRGVVTTYAAILYGPQWTRMSAGPLAGLPSRARLSRDGTRGATTAFVHGDSYASPGQFSTRTTVSGSGDLESFALRVDGRPVTAADRNVWGVTFVDARVFYATAASGGRTWLVRGDLADRTLTAIREDAECPSLSPDGTRVAVKRRAGLPAGRWRLAVVDLATGRDHLLAEQRSVDDQVEWLDDQTVLYGLPRGRQGSGDSDIWAVPADGGGPPRLFIPDAWSPAVLR